MRFKGHRWRNSFLNLSHFFLAFEWDLRDIDGAIHLLEKKSSGIIYIYYIFKYIYMYIYIYVYTIQTCVIYSINKQK